MPYISTRGQSGTVAASAAVLQGLAPDGGLFVPSKAVEPYPAGSLPCGSYREIAADIFKLFLDDYSFPEINHAVSAAYNREAFDHEAITPLKHLSDGLYVLELWHGPTSAFKDIALQALPHLLTSALRKSGQNREIVILTATSGDTGKSALEGFRDVAGVKIIVYFPEEGISEIQKLQMITQEGRNVGVFAVRGNFDHTQAGVKLIFKDRQINSRLEKAGYRLSSANSINWGRLLPQIVYYFSAYQDLVIQGVLQAGEKINFVVPTGNFGNILAGYYAGRLGLPVNRLICASNRNNVLSDFINSGLYDSRRSFFPTLSPSMDILVSSNLERLLFELTDHDSGRINHWMAELNETGRYKVDRDTLAGLQELFWSDYADDEETLCTIAETYRDQGYLIDPHTAVGKNVLDKYLLREKDFRPTILLSTASPFKFTGSTVRALFAGGRLEDLSELELIKVLAEETNITVPSNLVNLDQKPVLYRQVIAPEEMPRQLLKYLEANGR